MSRTDPMLEESGIPDLREEAKLRLEEASDPVDETDLSPAEMKRELQLQRIEIELQNKQLRRYRNRLASSREEYADLYFHAPVGYLTLDREGNVGELNYLAAELLGASRKSVIDSSLFDLAHSQSGPDLERHLEDTFEGTGVNSCRVAVELPTGDTAHLEMLTIAVDDPESGRLQCRAALIDVTERHRAEERKEYLEKQLQQSHRLETIGRLASGIAHDFNNLLTLIIGYSKLAINQLPDDHVLAKHVREIHKAGRHASELIEQLLAFSRSDGTSSTAIDVNEIIDDMEMMFDRLIGDDIELHLRLDENLGSTRFDSAQFQQVLLNLIVNARDAISGGGNLVIRTQNVELTDDAAARLDLDGGPYVITEVEDDGDGIPPEIIPHIFEPFFTTKETDDNHGFGLSTTYGIVSRHGGAIDVVSPPDGGTTFYVYLPRTAGDNIDETTGKRPAVLVVDDQPDLREFASLVLDDIDVEVLSAPSPEEALQISQACGDELTLVVTDVTMPGMSGPRLLEKIQRTHPDTDVLYMSGYDRESVSQQCDVELSGPFLEKPFTPDALLEQVETLLDDD